MNKEKKIVFIVPKGLGISGFPFGIAILSAILIKAGYSVSVIDANAYSLETEDVIKELIKEKPFIVGFTGLVSNYLFLKETSLLLKKSLPGVKQIAGGWWVNSITKTILSETSIDVVVEGEADEIIINLCNSLLYNNPDLTNIPNINYFDKRKIFCQNKLNTRYYPKKIDELPFPAYELFNLKYYFVARDNWTDYFLKDSYWDRAEFNEKFHNIKWIRGNMYSGRGCFGNCTFCCAAGIKRRSHSPKYVVDHIEFLYKKYGINFFRFTESLTISTREWVKEFCKELITRKLNILYWAQLRGDFKYDEEVLELLKKSGAFHLKIGFESGDDNMLKLMKKNTKIQQYLNVINALRKYKIWVSGTFVLNMPGESDITLRNTINFVRKSKLKIEGATFAVPNPGSELFTFAKRKGFIENEKQLLEKNPGKGYGKDDFSQYIAKYNWNKLSKQTLINAEFKLSKLVKINWFYEKNYIFYYIFLYFPFTIQFIDIELLKKFVSEKNKTNFIGQLNEVCKFFIFKIIRKIKIK